MKLDFNIASFDDFNLGISGLIGEDENGEFNLLSFGFLLFSIDLYVYR